MVLTTSGSGFCFTVVLVVGGSVGGNASQSGERKSVSQSQ